MSGTGEQGRMRVLIVGPAGTSAQSRGGMATVVTRMLEIAHPPGTPVEFIVVPTYKDCSRLGKTVVGVTGMVRSAFLIVTGRTDLLHVHLAHGGSVLRKAMPIAAARLRGVPVVIHAHSYNFAQWYRGLSPILQRATRAALAGDQWLVLGHGLAEEYTQVLALPPSRVQVLHNPAPTTVESDARPVGDPIIGVALGRLGERKGTYDVITAIGLLDDSVQARIRVILAGDGEVEKARSAARHLPAVEVRDWIGPTERDELLAAATFFLLPSYDEGLPMALLESMAAGLVPIVSPVGAIGDVVIDGVSGYLVEPGDTVGISAAIEQIVTDPRHTAELHRNAVARAADFSFEKWRAQLLRIWATTESAPCSLRFPTHRR